MTEVITAIGGWTDTEQVTVMTVHSMESIGPDAWNTLWRQSDAPTVFSCYEWLNAWWRTCHENRELRIYAARHNGRLVGLLPTAWPSDDGRSAEPVVLLGDGHADYAAILFDPAVPAVLDTLLDAVCEDLPADGSLLLRQVRSDSDSARRLTARTRGTLSRWYLEGVVPCPRASLNPDRVRELTGKKSLRRHARKLAQAGVVSVNHYRNEREILPRLEGFFVQHVTRWAKTEFPSLFSKANNRAFYRELVEQLTGTGRLVYSEVTLDSRPVACHLGFISEDDLIWYKPSFDPALSKMSPGEVLIQALLLWACDQGLAGLDFTRGGEAFKRRFSDQERQTLTFAFHVGHLAAILKRIRVQVRRAIA